MIENGLEDYEYRQSLEYIEKYAREELGMIDAGDTIWKQADLIFRKEYRMILSLPVQYGGVFLGRCTNNRSGEMDEYFYTVVFQKRRRKNLKGF